MSSSDSPDNREGAPGDLTGFYAEKHVERMRQLAALREVPREESTDVFTFAMATPEGMVESTFGMDAAVQAYNPEGLADAGYHKETKLSKRSGTLGQIRENHLGFIEVEVYIHGRDTPSKVRIHLRRFKVGIDDKKMRPYQEESGNWVFPLNKPLLCARIWAQDNLRGWDDTLVILDGPEQLLQPRKPMTRVPRVPREEERKQNPRGRPSGKPTPAPAADRRQEGAPTPEFRQFERDKYDPETHAYVIRRSPDGSSVEAALPLGDARRALGISPDPAAPTPATFLPSDDWKDVLVSEAGVTGATAQRLVYVWSGGIVDDKHPSLHQCLAHLRKIIERHKDGFEHDGIQYKIIKAGPTKRTDLSSGRGRSETTYAVREKT